MRYTETSHKIENPADLIRVVSSCVILSLFRMVNEYSKRVMFLGKEKLRLHLLVALCINGLLLLGEFVHRFIIGDRVIVILETHFIPLLISFIVIAVLLFVVNKSTSLSFEVAAKPDSEEVNSSEPPGIDFGEPGVNSSEQPGIDFGEPGVNLESPGEASSIDFEMPGDVQFSVEDGYGSFGPGENDTFSISSAFVSAEANPDFEPHDESDFFAPQTEDTFNAQNVFDSDDNLLSSILSGKDLDAISAEVHNKENSLQDIMNAIGDYKNPNLNDFPDTSPEVKHEINKNIDEDRFGIFDSPEIDLLDNQEELNERFNELFGI